MEQIITSLTLEEAKALRSQLDDRIAVLVAERNITTIKNIVDKFDYCVFDTKYEIDGMKVMSLPVKVRTSAYKDRGITLHEDQHNWYNILRHILEGVIPEDAKITNLHDGSGVGHFYLYYKTTEIVANDTKYLVVTEDGDILKYRKHADRCDELIRLGKAVPIY